MLFVGGLIAALIVISPDRAVHPDELSHLPVFHYYARHWLAPPVDDPAVIPSLSVWGYSYLYELSIVYRIAAWLMAPLAPIAGGELAVARAFQWLLWMLLTCVCLRSRRFALPMSVLLLSPQVWYLFGYFNSDAFALFLAAILILTVYPASRGVHAYVARGDADARFVVFVICTGLLLVSKADFLPLLPGVLLWIAVPHLPIRFGELLGCFLGLSLLGTAVFTADVPGFALAHLPAYATACAVTILASVTATAVRRCLRDREHRGRLRRLIAVAALIVAVAGPRLVEDVARNGMPAEKAARMTAMEQAHAIAGVKPDVIARGEGTLLTGLAQRGVGLADMLFSPPYDWFRRSALSTFGVYGYLVIFAPWWTYYAQMFAILCLAAVGAIALWRAAPEKAPQLLMVAIGTAFVVLLSSALHSWTFAFQAQGRYLLPILFMLGLMLGHASRELPRRPVALVVGVAFVASVCSFAFVALPAFARL